jgi:hypothetical protein
MPDYSEILARLPTTTAVGDSTVRISRPAELNHYQTGFAVGPNGVSLCGDCHGDWRRSWVVIGLECDCGDPVFIDTSIEGYPVYTAWHGQGWWDQRPVAVSLEAMRETLITVAEATRGRETSLALTQNPLSVLEREAMLETIRSQNPGIDLFFWVLLLGDDPEDWITEPDGRLKFSKSE